MQSKTYSAFQLNSLWGVKFRKCMKTAHCDTEAAFTFIPVVQEVNSIYFFVKCCEIR